VADRVLRAADDLTDRSETLGRSIRSFVEEIRAA
jgi:hypothetical protein